MKFPRSILLAQWALPLIALLHSPAAAQVSPGFVRQPVSLSRSLGDRAVFNINVRGDDPLSYQWLLNGSALVNATNRQLILTNLTFAMAGSYTVTVSNPLGKATSEPAMLDVDTVFSLVSDHPAASIISVGASWVDYDVDGRLDLFSTSGASIQLYHNEGGGRFARASNLNPLLRFQASGTQIAGGAWGDYDNDGLPDVFLPLGGEWTSGKIKNVLFRNLGNGDFVRITKDPIVETPGQAVTAVWGDFDGDGWLDLVAPSVAEFQQPGGADLLFRNERNGRFISIVNEEWLPDLEQNFDGAWGDLDGDGDLDLLVSTRSLRYLENQGAGIFEPFFMFASAGPRARGIALGDYDNDGDLDVFLARDLTVNQLFRNDGISTFTEVSADAGVQRPEGAGSYSGSWADYDNDGWLDLFVSNYTDDTSSNNKVTSTLFHNNGDGTLTRINRGSPVNGRTQGTAGVWGDYDEDGFLDLFITYWDGTPGFPTLFRNNGNNNAWLKLKLVGTKSNRSAYGAKVRLKATLGGKSVSQLREISTGSPFVCQNDPRAHFGLGDATQADEVRIEWPSGQITELKNIPAKQILTITEPGGKPQLHVTRVQGVEQFSLRGDAGQKYAIEASSDLLTWSEITTLTGASEPVVFNDARRPSSSQTFYRAVVR